MKSPRINWRSKTIHAIMNIDGLNEEEATSKFNRIYRQARQAIGAHQKEVNVTRELYGTLVYRIEHTFESGDSGNKITLNKIIDPKNLRYSITESRMQGFLEAYGDQKLVQETFALLQSKQITQREFNARIKIFKKWNPKYLKAGS